MTKSLGRGRGRPKGSRNNRTLAAEAELKNASARVEQALEKPFKGDAHSLLMLIYKDQALPWSTRIDAAKAALPYEKPKLQAVEVSGKGGGPAHPELPPRRIIHDVSEESVRRVLALVK